MRYSYCLLAVLFLFSCGRETTISDNPPETTEYYANPILAGWYPDPSITSDDQGNFYMVHSTFAFYPGIPVFHSTDLVNWKQIGNVLDRPEQLELEGFGSSRGIFAPDISFDNGTFYVTCTLVDGRGNFVVTTSDPGGSWSDPVWLPEVSGIDPGLFFDTQRTWLIYNSDAPENKPLYDGHRTIRIVEFDKENLKVIGENRIIVNGGVDISEEPVWAEGPRIYKLNDYYYLMTAEGGTAIEHSEVIYRTRDITGEFIPYEGNPILTQRDLNPDRPNPITSAGHADLVQHPNGDWYGIFLACRDYGDDHYNTGRETFMAPVKWENDWPVFDLGGEEIKYFYPLPDGTTIDETLFPLSGNFTFNADFNDDQLAMHWLFLRTVYSPWYFTRNGYLEIQTRPETISGKSNPSFIGHRQQHINSEVETAVEFSPENENESAGIIAFQNETHYFYLAKSMKEGNEVIQLIQGNENGEEIIKEEITESPVQMIYFRIVTGTEKYRFYYSADRNEWTELGSADTKYLSTRVAGGFVGVTIGMYTTSKGTDSENTARYDYFQYTGMDPEFEKIP